MNMSVKGFLSRGHDLLIRGVARGLQFIPWKLYGRYQQSCQRAHAEQVLARFALTSQEAFRGCVLVDSMWDNPNYWIRYTLLRSALGLAAGREVGVVGPYRAKVCGRTLERFGIFDVVPMAASCEDRARHCQEASRLLSQTKTSSDILKWELPYGVPADFVYDGILKRQRAACVDLSDRCLPEYISEALGCISAAARLLSTHKFDLVVLSHAVNFHFTALAWLAIQRGIPVVLAYGNYGVARYTKLTQPQDMYNTTDCPAATDLIAMSPSQAKKIAAVGMAYLEKRRTGGTDDIGAQYAYQRAKEGVNRAAIVEKFHWEPHRPIIAVYASNWFDFPHYCGMTHFRDFLDWMQATLKVAVDNRQVNWLFKAHPCDEWYGGVTLPDLMPSLEGHDHIKLVPKEWNGSALLDAVDGIVTYHGTVSVEAAALGKPVLVSDRGWTHDVGFVKWPQSRDEYLEALATDWWKDLDLDVTTERARVFAGWYFCRPVWQSGFVLDSDTLQGPIYESVPRLFEENGKVLQTELQTIRDWFHSGGRHYHTYKMARSENYTC